MKRKLLLLIIVILQLSFIAGLGYVIYEKRKNVLGIADINPISKEDIVYNPDSKLKYFYEPNKNDHITNKYSWLKHPASQTINSDTLNERYNYAFQKPKDVFRIIALGDSFTYGINVDTKNNWVELLEDKLNQGLSCRNITKIEVINLGVPGYDIRFSVERFRLRGQKYNPDLVLWFLKDDDFDEIEEYLLPLEHKFKTDLEKKGAYPPNQEVLSAVAELNKQYSKQAIENYQRSGLRKFMDIYKEKLIVFSVFNDKSGYPSFNSTNKMLLLDEIKNQKNSVFFDDFLITKYDYRVDSFYPNDFHPNEKGHQIIADDLYGYLKNNNVIPCR